MKSSHLVFFTGGALVGVGVYQIVQAQKMAKPNYAYPALAIGGGLVLALLSF